MSGRPKIGSTAASAAADAGAPYQYSANVVQSAIMPEAGDERDDQRDAERDQPQTGSTGSVSGWPLIRIGRR